MDDAKHLPTIVESYKDYSPPFNARRIVERLIDDVPPKYLGGLKSIVLTNSGKLNYSRRRSKTRSRGRKVPIQEALGVYHGKRRGDPIWIELFIDNMTKRWPRPLLWFRLFQDFVVGSTFFHELGHHVHSTKVPKHKEREDVADNWSVRFMKSHIRKRHHITFATLWLLRKTIGPVIKPFALRRLATLRRNRLQSYSNNKKNK